jgi:carbamoyl-phosphate synthase large subunit
LGFTFFATDGTAQFLKQNQINVSVIHKRQENNIHNVITLAQSNKIHLIVNIPNKSDIEHSLYIRRAAIMNQVSYVTTVRGFDAMARSIQAIQQDNSLHPVHELTHWISESKNDVLTP